MRARTTEEKRAAYLREQIARAHRRLELAKQRVNELEARAAELAEQPEAPEAA